MRRPGAWAVAVRLETECMISFPEVDSSEFGHQVVMSCGQKKHLKGHNKGETPQTHESIEMCCREGAGSARLRRDNHSLNIHEGEIH